MAAKSKLSRLLTVGKWACADAPLDHPPLALEQLELGQAQQVGGMVDTLRRALPGQLVVLAQEGRQLERLEVVRQQELGRVAHAAAPREQGHVGLGRGGRDRDPGQVGIGLEVELGRPALDPAQAPGA